jgi:hypothetical protein
VQDVLALGCLTELFAPRGIGKSLLADHWAVRLASSGKRVLILDRDNSRHTLRSRLHSLGANDLAEQKANLKVISREKCPPLTKPDEWAAFPYAEHDVVIVDSLDAMAEGIGEQDSSKPARAMAPLLDICRREGGPAVLLLGNTIKSAEHSRGSGVVEDRADIVYEVRDATDFTPSASGSWIEELPPQGAREWAARSSRRKEKTVFRVALVATKFRLGEEPAEGAFLFQGFLQDGFVCEMNPDGQMSMSFDDGETWWKDDGLCAEKKRRHIRETEIRLPRAIDNTFLKVREIELIRAGERER